MMRNTINRLKTLCVIALCCAFCLAGARTARAFGNHLDLSFTGDGTLTNNLGGYDQGNAVAIQSDGKIVVAGASDANGDYDFAVARYTSAGILDPGFGSGGKVLIDFQGGVDVAEAIAIQTDGKIVVAGSVDAGYGWGVLRLNSNGTLDTSFSSDGKRIVDLGGIEYLIDVALQADGKIVAAGMTRPYGANEFDFGVARLNSNGTIDTTFGGDGRVITDIGSDDRARALVIESSGKIVVAGSAAFSGQDIEFALVRYTSTGALDTTFSGDGKVTTDITNEDDYATSLRRTSDGKYVLAGHSGIFVTESKTALARYNSNGSLDTSFDGDGMVVTNIAPDRLEYANDFILNISGDIIIAGTIYDSGSIQGPCFTLVRYHSNGSLDARFGTGGRVNTLFGSANAGGAAIALQANARIVAVGTYYISSDTNAPNFAVARYTQSGAAAPSDFTGDGRADYALFRPAEGAFHIQNSANSGVDSIQFGQAGDIPVPGDYDRDGDTDAAVFRPSNSTWYIRRSSDQIVSSQQFGASGDKPVQGDYDGDGRADLATFRPSNGTWSIQRSTLGFTSIGFGASQDKPSQGDYDGDGRTDVSFFRPSTGTWYAQRSILGLTFQTFGASGDLPVPADYNGDGRTDMALYRPSTSTWYISNSQNNELSTIQWGMGGDIPAPADYDGDGRADLTVFRPGDGSWYVLRSTDGGVLTVGFGQNGDVPVASAYVPQ